MQSTHRTIYGCIPSGCDFRQESVYSLKRMKTLKQLITPDRLFRAFADRTRLRILNLLTAGELCVCDLVNVLDVPQPTASRHLGYLRRAGLVVVRKENQWSFYRLAPTAGPLHRTLLECIQMCCNEMPELARDTKRLRGNTRSCCK